MKKNHILNAELIKVIAGLGHTQTITICDAGFPIPPEVKSIDLSLVKGIPTMLEVLKAVEEELAVESYMIASELEAANPQMRKKIHEILQKSSENTVSHEQFKELSKMSFAIIRTGECSSFANIILIGGVNF